MGRVSETAGPALARRLGAAAADRTAARPLRVAVTGEFGAGKTSLINALLGGEILPAGVVVRTRLITVIGFAPRRRATVETAERRRIAIPWTSLSCPPPAARRLHVGLPLARLARLRLIDAPGLGQGDWEMEQRTLRACSRADIVVWCTPAVQAWKASEQRAWLGLSERVRRSGILAVTFSDAVTAPGDAERLLARLTAEAGPLFDEIVF
jgi:GTPase Era involved in 16S rRNA processing